MMFGEPKMERIGNLVTPDADWVERPGHEAVVVDNDIVLFGGFGLSTDPNDPFKPSNPIDMWVSEDGANWELLELRRGMRVHPNRSSTTLTP